MKIKSLIAGFTRNNVNIHKVLTKYNGFFKVNEYQLSHTLFNGEESPHLSREIFERGDAVVLIPYDPIRDSLVFNQQFRPGALRTVENPWLLEFVAGMFVEHESPQDVAIREAKEEANLTVLPQDIEPVMEYLSSPGGTSEKIHLYVAKVDASNVGGVFGLAEEGEDIRVSEIKRDDAMVLLAEGEICNAATIIGLQWLALNSEMLRVKWRDNGN